MPKIRTGKYTEPVISPVKPTAKDMKKSWFVWFRFFDENESDPKKAWKLRPYKADLNSYTDYRVRLAKANALRLALKEELDKGYNPLTCKYEREEVDDALRMEILPFNKALDFAFEKKKAVLAKKSKLDYSVVIEFAKAAARRLKIGGLPVNKITKRHIKLLLDQMATDRQLSYNKGQGSKRFRGIKFSANSYNKYKKTLGSMFSELEEYEMMEYNPCHKIKDREEISTGIHRHATDKERAVIKRHLQANFPDFYLFLDVEFQTGLRPTEILGLQISDIDWLNQCFMVLPIDGKSKTKKERMVPIPVSLMQKIEALQLQDYPPDYHIFSCGYLPGAKRIRTDRATGFWRREIKEGLGINVSLYSFKGLGGDARRDAGISLEAVSAGFGHSSLAMTVNHYTHKEKERMRLELINKSPEL